MTVDFQNIKTLILTLIIGLSSWVIQAKNWPSPLYHYNLYDYEDDCDLCGCSTSSGSFGFGTLSNANFVGVRYIYQSYESRSGIFSNSPTIEEDFNTYQVWAQIPIYKTFYVTTTIPYQDLYRHYPDGLEEHIKGLGDINAVAWYKWQFYKKETSTGEVDLNKTEPEKSPHAIQFGVGIKLPTGEFEESLTNRINPGFQVGTGSFDGIFSLGYLYSKDRFGLNTLATYYVKGENKNDYQFGNQFSYALNAYYAFPFSKINVMPFAGISGDKYDSIKQYDEVLADTDGSLVSSSLGFELATKRFIFGTNFTWPIAQDMFGDTVNLKNRFSVYFNIAL